MIHGMFCSGWHWSNFEEFFKAKGYTCICPTLRHHDIDPKGQPHPELGTTSLLDYVQDLDNLIRKLDQKPIIMGHSMGGLLAQILGSRGLGKALVLLTTAPPSGINALRFPVIKSFWSVLTKWGFWRNPHRLSFESLIYAMLHLLPLEDQKAVYERFVYESGRAASEIGFWFIDPNRASKVDESKVTCPVLVIAGANDIITPAPMAQKVAKKYKAVSTYKEFENHAHWIMGEPNWEKIAEFISDWLNFELNNRIIK
jgi:pimeloyl-ACP methyl ester carboxylesterase